MRKSMKMQTSMNINAKIKEQWKINQQLRSPAPPVQGRRIPALVGGPAADRWFSPVPGGRNPGRQLRDKKNQSSSEPAWPAGPAGPEAGTWGLGLGPGPGPGRRPQAFARPGLWHPRPGRASDQPRRRKRQRWTRRVCQRNLFNKQKKRQTQTAGAGKSTKGLILCSIEPLKCWRLAAGAKTRGKSSMPRPRSCDRGGG